MVCGLLGGDALALPPTTASLIQIWVTAGAYDQLNLVGVAAMEELARRATWMPAPRAGARFHTGFWRAGDALIPSLPRHVA